MRLTIQFFYLYFLLEGHFFLCCYAFVKQTWEFSLTALVVKMASYTTEQRVFIANSQSFSKDPVVSFHGKKKVLGFLIRLYEMTSACVSVPTYVLTI
jgi:hypothetical protein